MYKVLSRRLWRHRGVLRAPVIHHVNRSLASLSCLRSEQPSSSPTAASIPWHREGETPVAESQQTSSTNALFAHLSKLSNDKVRSELGEGPEDHDSTLFLRLFHNQLSISSVEEKAIARINLFCSAIFRKHPGYTKQDLYTAFMECASSRYSVSDDLGFSVVSALLAPRPAGEVLDTDKEIALRVLEHLSLRGTNIVNMKVFNMIYRASGNAPSALSRVSRLIDTLDLPFDPVQARSLMVSLFHHRDYNGFWKLWRKLPLNGSPRTVADYEMLFRLHADLGDELRARDCLSTWMPMMSREQRPIRLSGGLLVDIKRCLVLADRDIVQKAAEGSTSNLARLWKECQSRTLV